MKALEAGLFAPIRRRKRRTEFKHESAAASLSFGRHDARAESHRAAIIRSSNGIMGDVEKRDVKLGDVNSESAGGIFPLMATG